MADFAKQLNAIIKKCCCNLQHANIVIAAQEETKEEIE
jgi:hypothetical protein